MERYSIPTMRSRIASPFRLSGRTRNWLCISSAFLGLASLYSGLYGGGTAWTTVSAITGTLSLACAVLPSLVKTGSNVDNRIHPTYYTVPNNGTGAEWAGLGTSLSEWYRKMFCHPEMAARARRLQSRRAVLLAALLRKILLLTGNSSPPHEVLESTVLIRHLIAASRSAPPAEQETVWNSDPPQRRVRAVRGPISRRLPAQVVRELQVYRETQHANIASFAAGDPETASARDHFAAPLGGAATARPSLSEFDIIVGIARGLEYLHSLEVPVIHGDLRAANIHISPESNTPMIEIPIERWTHQASTTYHLTHDDIARHLSPEIVETSLFRGSPRSNEWRPPPTWADAISLQADIYALSITIFELITGSKPFSSAVGGEPDLSQILEAVTQGDRPALDAEQLERFFASMSGGLASPANSSQQQRNYSLSSVDPQSPRHTGVDSASQRPQQGQSQPYSPSFQQQQPDADFVQAQPQPHQLQSAIATQSMVMNRRRRSGAANGLMRLLEMMWAQDPAQRPSVHQVVDRFEELSRFEEVIGD